MHPAADDPVFDLECTLVRGDQLLVHRVHDEWQFALKVSRSSSLGATQMVHTGVMLNEENLRKLFLFCAKELHILGNKEN